MDYRCWFCFFLDILFPLFFWVIRATTMQREMRSYRRTHASTSLTSRKNSDGADMAIVSGVLGYSRVFAALDIHTYALDEKK